MLWAQDPSPLIADSSFRRVGDEFKESLQVGDDVDLVGLQ